MKLSANCFSNCFSWLSRLFSRNSSNGSHTGDSIVIANPSVSSLNLNSTDTSTTYQIPKPKIKNSTSSTPNFRDKNFSNSTNLKNKMLGFSSIVEVKEFNKTEPAMNVSHAPSTYYARSYDWVNE